jgi:hypothetical protein
MNRAPLINPQWLSKEAELLPDFSKAESKGPLDHKKPPKKFWKINVLFLINKTILTKNPVSSSIIRPLANLNLY